MNDHRMSRGQLIGKIFVRVLLFIAVMMAVFFLTAGTFDYWEAWVYLAVMLVPMFGFLGYFLAYDPELLERRMRMKEKEAEQKVIIKVASVFYVLTFLVPGFDRRFQWSDVPAGLVIAANVLVLTGYVLIFLVMRENRYASRIIEVEPGQKVVTSGPYAIVRHPMYVGALLMFLATPVALGSYWALIPAVFLIPILVARIRNEEKVLERDLAGYQDYMQKTSYRLIPWLW
jgi:protein-S-isoprenylcysteine O-methyltransferase Ste14